MKFFLKTVLLIILVTVSTGCAQDINEKEYTLDVKKGVDIWNSINYEIITDTNAIKEIDPATEGSIMIRFSIRIENRGKEKAESFSVNLIEAKPLNYVDASSNAGTDHGYLDNNEGYQVNGYYIFKTFSDAEDFIENSNVIIKWVEEKENKEIKLKLPSKPTH